MTPGSKHALDLVAKGYVAVAVAYCFYSWVVPPFSAPRSVRIAIAVIGFGLCVWLPERFTDSPYAVPLLKVFGTIGITVMMYFIHIQATQ